MQKTIHPDDMVEFEKMIDAIRIGKESFSYEMRSDFIYDGYTWIWVEGRTIFSSEGNPKRVLGRLTNVDKEKKSAEGLLRTAQRDPLTELLNKAVTREKVEEFVTQQKGEGISALMIIDIDNFKCLNDSFGHLFGDDVLVSLAKKLNNIFRSQDIVGRIGGDEFLVFMKDVSSLSAVKEKAVRISEGFKATYTTGQNSCDISCSIGVSIFPEDGESYDSLFEKADKSLYKAKIDGKNQFSIYDKSASYDRDGKLLKRRDEKEN